MKKTILFYLAVLGALLILGYKAYDLYETIKGENKRLHEELVHSKERFVQLSKHAAKLAIDYENQTALKKKLEEDFKEEKEALKGRLKVLSNATFLIREKARKTGKSDFVYQGNMFKYVLNELRFNDGPPIGYVLIFDDGRVVSKIYNHQIDVKMAVSRDEDTGNYSIVSKADYILKSPSLNTNGEKVWTNKPYPLEITGGKAVVDPTEKNQLTRKFHLLAPHINANFNFSKINPYMGFGVSVAGYGLTKNDLDFKFLQLGVHYLKGEGLNPTFTPILWRPFNGLLSNTYLGPGVALRNAGVSYFLGIQIGL